MAVKIFLLFVCAFILVAINSAFGYGEVSASNFKMVNSLGEEIRSPVVGQQLNLQTSLQNVSEKSIDWVYIVQIVKDDDTIADLNYAKGSLVSNQTLTAALSWIPYASGTYKIETFVWNNLLDIDPLAPMSSYTITVT